MKIKKRVKLVRPVKGRERFSHGVIRCGYHTPRSWKPWRWRIVFTISFTIPAEYPKGSFKHQSYFYTDSTCIAYATPKPGTGLTYTGSGATLGAATKDLETKILASHSKSVAKANKERDKQLEALVAKLHESL